VLAKERLEPAEERIGMSVIVPVFNPGRSLTDVDDLELHRCFGEQGMPYPSVSFGQPVAEFVNELRTIRSREEAVRWVGRAARRAGRLAGRRRARA
jgi:hypothetical protein